MDREQKLHLIVTKSENLGKMSQNINNFVIKQLILGIIYKKRRRKKKKSANNDVSGSGCSCHYPFILYILSLLTLYLYELINYIVKDVIKSAIFKLIMDLFKFIHLFLEFTMIIIIVFK